MAFLFSLNALQQCCICLISLQTLKIRPVVEFSMFKAARAIAGDILELLWEAFEDQRPLMQLLTAFRRRRQRPAETVLEFSHSLQVLAAGITGWDPDTLSARSLRDRFCEGLAEMGLKRELCRMARENADITLAALRQEALPWVREESPVDTVRVQQLKTDSSETALLKTLKADVTEATQVAVKSLAAPRPPTTTFRGRCYRYQKTGRMAKHCPKGHGQGGN